MDRSIAWRAALLQALLVTAVAVLLAVTLPRSFFEGWGWLAGPVAWALCALGVAFALRLRWLLVLAGAAISGVLMLPGVVLGVHWLGGPLAVAAFGFWCGWLASPRVGVAT